MTIEGCDFHPAGKCGSETEPERFSYLKRKCRRAYCGAPALSASILRPRQINLVGRRATIYLGSRTVSSTDSAT